MPTDAQGLADALRANAWRFVSFEIEPDAFRARQRELWAAVEAAGVVVRDAVLASLRGDLAS